MELQSTASCPRLRSGARATSSTHTELSEQTSSSVTSRDVHRLQLPIRDCGLVSVTDCFPIIRLFKDLPFPQLETLETQREQRGEVHLQGPLHRQQSSFCGYVVLWLRCFVATLFCGYVDPDIDTESGLIDTH